MRIPVGKVYRAFEELDRFSDEQCAGYVRRAQRQHLLSMMLMALVAIVVVIVVIVGALVGEVFLMGAIENTLFMVRLRSGWTGDLVFLIGGVLPFGVGLVAGLLVRDFWLRWAIRKELNTTLCLKCDYQLLGLPLLAEGVRCPECGMNSPINPAIDAAQHSAAARK